jgi:urea transport system permease protein
VRAVTQNRQMASAIGVRTPKIDMLAFGLGSGIAGLAAARSRRSATWDPTSARATSWTRSWWWCWEAWGSSPAPCMRALGLGIANKFLEAWQGAVLAKIAVLVFIIIFIQKRPQGLFALKGRQVDA